MNKKKTFDFFFIALPLCIILRIIQIAFTIDGSNGFFIPERKVLGLFLLLLIVLACSALAIFSMLCIKKEYKAPKMNWPLAIISIAFAISTTVELVNPNFTPNIHSWQIITLYITGIPAVLFFILYGLSLVFKITVSKICTIIPTIYFFFRIICVFSGISEISLITDNVILIATYCVSLIFLLNFAKIYNNITPEKTAPKLFASGLAGSVLCFTNSIPSIIGILIKKNEYTHNPISSNISILILGCFILCFTLMIFYKPSKKAIK